MFYIKGCHSKIISDVPVLSLSDHRQGPRCKVLAVRLFWSPKTWRTAEYRKRPNISYRATILNTGQGRTAYYERTVRLPRNKKIRTNCPHKYCTEFYWQCKFGTDHRWGQKSQSITHHLFDEDHWVAIKYKKYPRVP